MVAPTIACAFNTASGLLVSGICSYYESLDEERRMKEQEEALRRSIRLELERSRDEERRQKRKRDDDESEIFELCLRAERRRKLIARRIIASHRNAGEGGSEILKSDSLVDCLEEEEKEEECAAEEKIKGEEKENNFIAVKLHHMEKKKKMATENLSTIFRTNSLIDCLEKEECEDQHDENSAGAEDDEGSLVTVALDSIGEQENGPSEPLSLDSIVL